MKDIILMVFSVALLGIGIMGSAQIFYTFKDENVILTVILASCFFLIMAISSMFLWKASRETGE